METIAWSTEVPQASLGDVASLNAVQRAGWTMRHAVKPSPASVVAPGVTATLVRATVRRTTAVAALRRLANDPAATSAERTLAAHRAELLQNRV